MPRRQLFYKGAWNEKHGRLGEKQRADRNLLRAVSPQPTRKGNMPEASSLNQSETEAVEPIELEVQVTKTSPIVRAALEFFAMRKGQTIEEYCRASILWDLHADEEDAPSMTFVAAANKTV
jgi:hypothetical protein